MTINLKKFIYPAFSYFNYWLIQEDSFSIQAPFLSEFYFNLKKYLAASKDKDLDFEGLRKKLLTDPQLLEITDFGAGSKRLSSATRSTSDVTRYSTTGRKFSQIYQFLCSQTPAQQVLELGTCVGINTNYLSRSTKGILYSLEGSNALWEKAQQYQKPDNTTFVLGKIEETLPPLLKAIKSVDFVLIDATHTYQGSIAQMAMLRPYVKDTTIIVLADIHWSAEMKKAWNTIREYPEITLSVDFFECGVLFFKNGITRENYVLAI